MASNCSRSLRSAEARRADFRALLRNATLSISQAGYNTVVDTLCWADRAVLVPFGTDRETEQTDRLMKEKMNEYVAPLMNRGATISPILRVGSPRHLIVEVASEIEVDLVVIGSHSKRGILDIALGGTAHHVSTHAPCMVLMVGPKKK